MRQVRNRLRMEIRNKIRNRIRSSRGMSIGEILLAILIMLLSTSVVVATVSLGLNQYINTLSRSEANVLSSTLQSLITNELAYTTEIYVDTDGKVTSFQSQNYTTDSALSNFSVSDNKVMIGTFKLLGDGSYPNQLGVSEITITYDSTKYIFDVSFKIVRGSTEILTQEFQVLNVNETEAS